MASNYTDINIDEIIAEWGKQYINQGQTAKDIKKMLFAKDDISADFRTLPYTNSHFRSSYATIDEVLQAFGIPFTAKSTNTFQPIEQKIGEFKIDVVRTPDKLWPSWLGFLADLKEVDRSKWSFIRWLIQEMLLPRAQKDFIEKVAYWGWEFTEINAAGTVNGATFVRQIVNDEVPIPANASMDGIKKQICKFVSDGRLTPIVMGAWSTDPVTFCEQIEAFVLEPEEELRADIDYLYMSETLKNRYTDGRREKYNMHYAQEPDLTKIDKVNTRVKHTRSMKDSEQVWGTTAMNRVMPTITNMANRFDVQKLDRQVKLLNDWKRQLTFEVPEFIITSEHETTISAQNIADHYS